MKVLAVLLLLGVLVSVEGFELTLLHTNDVHAHVEQMNAYGGDCSAKNAAEGKCYGGEARRATVVNEIRSRLPNVLLLDAGDRFMGTLFFSKYKGQTAAIFLDRLRYDAMCLGNHEFDLGVSGLVSFLNNVTVPVVSANTDVSGEPRLSQKFTKSTMLEIDGRMVGIVGYTTAETEFISNPGPTVQFLDEIASLQQEVDRLRIQGVSIIIALGHAGYAKDLEIANQVQGLDIVVGGHSNTFLYNGDKPSNDDITGPYPTIVTQGSSRRVLVVQDFAYGKYLGYLNVTFDDAGEVESWSGNPLLLDSSIEQDAATLAEVERLAAPLLELKREVVGATSVRLDGERETCRLQECNMGNLIADAIVEYHVGFQHSNSSWAPAAIAIMNGGGIRASVQKGNVTMGDLLSVLPFGNSFDMISIEGRYLRDAIEQSVTDYSPQEPGGHFLQYSGIRVEYNLNNRVGRRAESVLVRCLECDVPTYSSILDTAVYNVLVSDFLVRGGDGYSMFRDNHIQHKRFNSPDTNVMNAYLSSRNTVYPDVDGRIVFVSDTTGETSGASQSPPSSVLLGVFTLLLIDVAGGALSGL